MNFEPLSAQEEQIGKKIVDAAYTLDKALGPGLLERVYEVCICRELTQGDCSIEGKWMCPLWAWFKSG